MVIVEPTETGHRAMTASYQAFRIVVNGDAHTIEADGDTPLLWILRDRLGLTGSKYGCGSGYCGACLVHLNGAPVPSCTLPLSAVGDQAVVTIEGLDPEGLHPVQRAWISERVPQCGYCQAGQIMRAAALLSATPSPTDAQIRDGMQPQICRCGTYNRILRAVRVAATLAREDRGE